MPKNTCSHIICLVKILAVSCVLTTAIFSYIPTFIRAQEEADALTTIKIAPSILEVDTQPGKTLKKVITISNNSDIPIPTEIQVADYTVNELGVPDYSLDTTGWSPRNWITLKPEDIILSAHETKKIRILCNIPEEARPGSHVATILFMPVLPPDYFDPHSAHVIPYVGAILSLNVMTEDSTPRYDYLEIRDFRSELPEEEKNVLISSELYNNDVYVHRVNGSINIYNIFGKSVSKTEVESTTILPQKTRALSQSLKNTLPFGRYSAKIEIQEEDVLVSDHDEFWIPPTPMDIIKGLLFLVFAVLAAFITYILKYKRKNIRKSIQILLRKDYRD